MIDIEQTGDGDVKFEGGDIGYAESGDQHKKDMLLADKGHYKEHPDVGVGVINYLHDTNPENLLRAARREFIKDGVKVERISMTNGTIKVTGDYDQN